MIQSIDSVLTKIANEDAVPYIIAEIPTNPRVEVPNLIDLKHVLSQERKSYWYDCYRSRFYFRPHFVLMYIF
jgi:hypothetical protein